MPKNIYKELVNVPVSNALQVLEDYVDYVPARIGMHKYVGATFGDDRNDGFNRSFFSRSKNRFSRIRKCRKYNKRRHRKPWIYERHYAELLADFFAMQHDPHEIIHGMVDVSPIGLVFIAPGHTTGTLIRS